MKLYQELRFSNGLILSGFYDGALTDLLRNNAAPSQEYDPTAPMMQRNLAVVLQDVRVCGFAHTTDPCDAARAFHHRNEGGEILHDDLPSN